MAFEKMGSFTFNHADQADELNLAADTAKQKFDSRASELKTAINKVVDLLNATTDGASGADNVGATAISGVTGTTVQAQMKSMKGLVDGKAASGHDHDGSYAPTNLAGEGRTTETVKGNADAIAAHLADGVKHINYTTASGTNAYTATINGIESLTEGLSLKIKFINANTEAATLNINELGAKTIQKSNGSALSSGSIKAGQIVHLVYSGSVFQLLGEGGEYGTAGAAQVLLPYTIGTEDGLVTGTIPSKGAATITPGTTNQVISAGQYLSGAQTIAGDANLVPGNILSGKSIFGVSGGVIVGKKFATGTTTSLSTSSQSYKKPDGNTEATPLYPVTVSGLGFLPSIITLIYGDSYTVIYSSVTFKYDHLNYHNIFVMNTAGGIIPLRLDGTYAYVLPGSFSLPVITGGLVFSWTAWE